MRFFWGGHFEFSESAILNFFLPHLCEKSSPFIWGIIFFCTMDGFSRILEKKLSELLCTRLYMHFLFQVFGIFCTMAAEQLLSHTGNDLLANGMLAGVLLLGTILTAFIKADYRRQAASKPQGNLLMGIDNCWNTDLIGQAIDEKVIPYKQTNKQTTVELRLDLWYESVKIRTGQLKRLQFSISILWKLKKVFHFFTDILIRYLVQVSLKNFENTTVGVKTHFGAK